MPGISPGVSKLLETKKDDNMPGISVGVATLIAGAGATGAGVTGSILQSRSERGARADQRATDQAVLAQQRSRDQAAERQVYQDNLREEQILKAEEEERAYRRGITDREQARIDEYEARQVPYRRARSAALGRLGDILGIDFSGRIAGEGGQGRSRPDIATVDARVAGVGRQAALESAQEGAQERLTAAIPRRRLATSQSYDPVLPRRTLGDAVGYGRRRRP
jgi:hypothetical protein